MAQRSGKRHAQRHPAALHERCTELFRRTTDRRFGANLIQAQRDYFGAHTFERTDAPRGQFFHNDWTGKGGDTTSGSYNV